MPTFVTGFGPFGSIGDNPSSKLAQQCGREHRVLEVSYGAVDVFLDEFDPRTYDRLLLIGVAAGRPQMCLETLARNYTGGHADVRGCSRKGEIATGAPLLLEGTLWTPAEVADLLVDESRFRFSMDAGSYLCNYIYYRALQRFPSIRIGFLHVPSEDRLHLQTQLGLLREALEVVEA